MTKYKYQIMEDEEAYELPYGVRFVTNDKTLYKLTKKAIQILVMAKKYENSVINLGDQEVEE